MKEHDVKLTLQAVNKLLRMLKPDADSEPLWLETESAVVEKLIYVAG